jgi:multiple sugar transport system substrate-binding protein
MSRFPFFLAMMLILGVAFAHVPTSPAADRTVVTFWHAMGGSDNAEVLNDFIREFEAANPDVDIQSVYQGNYDQLSQKLIASTIAGSNPVMAQMYESWTSRFMKRGWMDPVEDHIKGPNGLTPEEVEDIWKPFRDNNSWDGKLVTLPFNKSAYVLYINKNMLDAAGIKRPPETWDELRDAARRMTVRTDPSGKPDVYGFLLRDRIEAYTAFLFRAGGHCLSSDNRTVTIADPIGYQTLEFLRSMVVDDRTAYTDNAYPAIPFGAGQVAMFVHSSAAFPWNDKNTQGKFTWIAAPIPSLPGHKGGTLFQGTNIGIFARPHSEKVREAAWRFLKYIANPLNAARWSIDTGYVPIRKSAVETPLFRKFLETHPNYRVPISLIPDATFDPKPYYWDPMRTQIATYALDAINGRKTPDEALKTITRNLQDIIDYEIPPEGK